MEKENRVGFGDVLITVAILMMIMKWVGVLTVSWGAIYHFNLFVLIYLVVVFVIDLTIAIVDAAIEKRE